MKATWTLAVALVLTGCAMPSSAAPASLAGFQKILLPTGAHTMPDGANNFYKSNDVTVQKVSFTNQYRMNVAGNLFVPRNVSQDAGHPAIVVGHPMGAVKEQSANLYATKLAEQGFVTLSLDLSFWGESEGKPGHLVAPEIYSDDFSAAVDFLSTQPYVDRERIGALGICGSGSFVISAAKIDPRMKAVATVSMYDMGSAARNGLKHSVSLEQRKALIQKAIDQRFVEFTGGEPQYIPGTVNTLEENTDPIQREFFDFYRTARGAYTPKGEVSELTTKPTLSSIVKFLNFYPFNDIGTISPRPLLFITGDAAHSREFSEDAYKRAAEPKELLIVPGAGHVDLYDRVTLIPFDRLTTFFRTNLKYSRPSEARAPDHERTMIRMDVDGEVVTASLDSSAASRDFAALLPLSLTLTNYARIERIADLPRKITVEGTTAGPVKAGDLAYYAPWGNLAIFAENGDAEYARGLVRLGRVESGLPALQRPGPLKVRMERIEE